jgi:uncharacterized membrane protein YeiH
MKTFFKSLLGSGPSTLSSKRFVGVLCVLSLIVSLMVSVFSQGKLCPDKTLVDVIGLLAFGSLGLTSTEMIFGKKYDNKKDDNQES